MHQPYYEDLATGEHILPWVRLHAIKDYWGMVAMLEEFPGVRMTFNLVPSLLVQIQAFAADRAQDRHLHVGMKVAGELDTAERAFLVANGFHAPYERMIRPHPRYAELHARRLRPETFSVSDLRDLQVLHKLAWIDPDWLRSDARLLALTARGRDFSEDDKQQLRAVELDLLNAVIPAYRDAAARGQVELSTSPFYHPILPLLCDSDVHFVAHPHSSLPPAVFERPQDAIEQLRRAIALHQSLFGAPPRGVWPSEGSISDAVVAMLASLGVAWTATDEEILARSLGQRLSADALYRPYRLAGEPPVAALFRDHTLSDLIGFTYQSWSAEAAADDFVGRVREAGRRFAAMQADAADTATIAVVLDGENAWEHYDGGGRPFLRALYRRLAAATDIETVTMHEAAMGATRQLAHVFPGSWINGDFYIWAGHGDDHRAWAQLAAARAAFDRSAPIAAEVDRARAWEELLIAEGSDWFWWYGDDHSSDHDEAFDDLFRRHLRSVYRSLGLAAPADLHASNITTKPAASMGLELPMLSRPTMDGLGRWVDWLGSVTVPLGGAGGAMHRVDRDLVGSLRVGADAEQLYLRLAGPNLTSTLDSGKLSLEVLVGGRPASVVKLSRDGADGARWVAGRVVEAAVPFDVLEARPGERVRLFVLVADDRGHILERHPQHQPLEFEVPSPSWAARRWLV
jgi:alpha-amylase/alpha-mannosidase (GH57 family)